MSPVTPVNEESRKMNNILSYNDIVTIMDHFSIGVPLAYYPRTRRQDLINWLIGRVPNLTSSEALRIAKFHKTRTDFPEEVLVHGIRFDLNEIVDMDWKDEPPIAVYTAAVTVERTKLLDDEMYVDYWIKSNDKFEPLVSGDELHVRIIEVDDETVTLDFWHFAYNIQELRVDIDDFVRRTNLVVIDEYYGDHKVPPQPIPEKMRVKRRGSCETPPC